MTHNKAILWLTTAFVLGASLGYLFNARFCKVSIGDRVEHEIKLNQHIRKLWVYHAIWINAAISSLQGNANQEQVIAQRLYKSQKDIGSSLTPFYGSRIASAITVLLNEHVTILFNFIKAKKENDIQSIKTQAASWQENSNAIARFLNDLNPAWQYIAVKKLVDEHVDLIKQGLTAYMDEDWKAAATVFDKSIDHVLVIADALYLGILKQFPQRF